MEHSGIMFLNVSMQCIVRISFYLILIGICITSWIKLLKEQTAFEEKVVNNKTRLPSFTLCPNDPYNDPITNKSIESFEDIKKAIDNVKYTMDYTEYKPYEESRTVEDENNGTSFGDWHFVPKISMLSPFEPAICLIWTPNKEFKLNSDWSIIVSLYMNLTSSLTSSWYSLQFHQESDSPYLYKFAQDQLLWFRNNNFFYIELEKQIETINIDKPDYTCNKHNSNSLMHCMEDYYSKKLGCRLPWAVKNNTRNDVMNKEGCN